MNLLIYLTTSFFVEFSILSQMYKLSSYSESRATNTGIMMTAENNVTKMQITEIIKNV
jgi:hypothetical protein